MNKCVCCRQEVDWDKTSSPGNMRAARLCEKCYGFHASQHLGLSPSILRERFLDEIFEFLQTKEVKNNARTKPEA